jgi:hypothetical protein
MCLEEGSGIKATSVGFGSLALLTLVSLSVVVRHCVYLGPNQSFKKTLMVGSAESLRGTRAVVEQKNRKTLAKNATPQD